MSDTLRTAFFQDTMDAMVRGGDFTREEATRAGAAMALLENLSVDQLGAVMTCLIALQAMNQAAV